MGVVVDEVADRAEVSGVLGQRGEDGGFERGGAVAGEQLQQPPGQHAKMGSAFGRAQEQGLGAGRGVVQPVLGAMGTGGVLVSDQGRDVGRVFDLGAAVEAARVGGDDALAVEDAHGGEAGQHGQRALDVVVRDAVVVPVEAHVGGLAHAHLGAFLGRERIGRQGQQVLPFGSEQVAHALAALGRAQALGRRPGTPRRGLGIEIVDIAEAARGEEGIAGKSDRPFHPPLLISAPERHRPRLEAVMRREFEQPRMEVDGRAAALEHGATQIVVEHDPGHGREPGEGVDVATNEVRHGRAEIEAQKEVARVGQHHHEGHQRPLGPTDGELAEVGPVALGLVPGKGAQTQVRFCRRAWPQAGNDGPEVIRGAGVTALAHHRVQARRPQRRVLGERRGDERQVRFRDRGPHRLLRRHARLCQHPAHRAVVHPQLPRNGSHRPVLGGVQAQDLGFEFARNHRVRLGSRPAAQRTDASKARQRSPAEAAARRGPEMEGGSRRCGHDHRGVIGIVRSRG
jgi:hypothetical protein